MPQPTVQQLHIDRVLTQISVKYTQNAEQFIAAKVFPRVLVDKKSDMYRIYNRNDWLRDDAKPRASLTESAGGGYRLSYGSYMAEVMAFHKDVGPQERANADEPLDMDRDAAEFVAGKLLLRMELQWAEEFFKTGVWGTDDTTAVNWDSYATSNPIGNVRAAKALILGQTGYEPNTLVLGFGVYNALLDHPDIIDRIKYSSSPAAPTMVTDSVLAALFGVERVLVAKAIKATNNEGAAVETYDFAFGKHALLAYAAQSPSLLAPSAGYQFVWKGVSGGLGTTVATYRIPIPLLGLGAERIEAETAVSNKVVAPELAYFWSNVIA